MDFSGLLKMDMAPFLGPAFVGILLNWFLLGIFFTQVQSYYAHYHGTDKWFIKTLVYVMLLVEILFTIGLTHGAFALIITSWGDPSKLFNFPWTVALIIPSNAISGLAVQCFFAWRIWMLINSIPAARIVPMLVISLSLMQLAAALGFTFQYAVKYKLHVPALREVKMLVVLVNVWVIGSFVTDLLIAVTMVCVLRRTKKSSVLIQRTENLITRLIISSVATGVVTTIVALVDLLLYMLPSMKGNNYYYTCGMILGKLYSNMLLANLNGRTYFQDDNSYTVHMMPSSSGSRGDIEMHNRRSTAHGSSVHRSQRGEIVVTTHIDKFVSPNTTLVNSSKRVEAELDHAF